MTTANQKTKQILQHEEEIVFIPSGLMTLTEVTPSLCPSNICVHNPAPSHTLKCKKSISC